MAFLRWKRDFLRVAGTLWAFNRLSDQLACKKHRILVQWAASLVNASFR